MADRLDDQIKKDIINQDKLSGEAISGKKSILDSRGVSVTQSKNNSIVDGQGGIKVERVAPEAADLLKGSTLEQLMAEDRIISEARTKIGVGLTKGTNLTIEDFKNISKHHNTVKSFGYATQGAARQVLESDQGNILGNFLKTLNDPKADASALFKAMKSSEYESMIPEVKKLLPSVKQTKTKVKAAIPSSAASRMEAPSVTQIKKRISLAEAMANSNKTAEQMLIPVKLVRTPGSFPSVSGGMYADDLAVSVQTMQGKHIDYLRQHVAKKLNPKIPSGELPTKGLLAKVFLDDQAGKSYISVGKVNAKGTFISSGLDTRSSNVGIIPEMEDILQEVISAPPPEPKTIPTAASVEPPRPNAKAKASAKVPAKTKARTAAPQASPRATAPKPAKVVPKIDMVPGTHEKFGGKNGSRLMIGLSVAAGALLLWGATKQKSSQPLSVRDVQNSPYGANNVSRTMAGQGYTPKVRLTPNNGGYATNVDIEATDNSGNTDYRSMANSMGAISRSSYGVNRSSTSLHIVDDSGRVDRESTRRSINQHLRD